MKRIIALALILAAPVTMADECRNVHTLAKSIMGARQAGVPIIDLLELVQADVADVDGLVTMMVKDAYATPQYHGEQFQQRAVKDFAERVYLVCAR